MTEPTVLDIFKIAYGPLPEGVTTCRAAVEASVRAALGIGAK